MAGKLSFMLSVEGTEAAEAKVTKLAKSYDKLNQSVQASGKSFGQLEREQNDILNLLTQPSSQLKIPLSATRNQAFANLYGPLPSSGSARKMNSSNLGMFLNQSLGIGAGQNSPSRAAYEEFWKKAIPPIAAPPVIEKSFLQSVMSKLPSSALTGLGGGGFGGILRGVMAGGGAGPVAVALAGITGAAVALRISLKELNEAVERGAKLFTDSARVGQSSGSLFRTRSALGMIGISNSEADQLMLNARFGGIGMKGGNWMNPGYMTGGRQSGSFAGAMLSSGSGILSVSEMQQIRNMSEYIDRAWKDAALDAQIAADHSKNLFEVRFQFEALKREWSAMWMQLASELGVFLKPALAQLTQQLQGLNFIISQSPVMQILKATGAIPKEANKNNADFGLARLPVSQWQNMGFIFGNGSNPTTQYAQQTAKNTQEMAAGIKQIVMQMGAVGTGGLVNQP